LMLDDDEFKRVTSLIDVKGHGKDKIFSAMVREYERITGVKDENPNAIYHHKLSMYGPPCAKCGKPLRSQRAKLCGACMAPVLVS